SEAAWEHQLYWRATDRKEISQVRLLIKEIKRDPYRGIGKPVALKHALFGCWSRWIDSEHRTAYKVEGDNLRIAQLRFRYEP
ncbi:MAG: Txe/YoeB family addiction module toxin, partial [Deinococcus sp.]|nr:Txe/YoeB family addiction module toxin [Deinococcus sp.]